MFLSPEMLINGYVNGYFPMAEPKDGEIYWHSPDFRAIIPLDGTAKVRKSLKQLYRNHSFDLYINRDFETVMRKCAALREGDTWINEDMIDAYCELHKEGFAHSFEAYKGKELVGGLYGISVGKAFFGESMFYTQSGASKVAYMFMLEFLASKEFTLLDSQYINNHTQSLVAIEVPRDLFLQKLDLAINRD